MMLEKDIVLKATNISKNFSSNNGFLNKQPKDNFWVLKDINFELKKGEILGIIGLNGAGKSTLLKILSQVLPPTSGEVEYIGSILPILDIGTGFHPDLSGYDNIFLNASILGMKKKQIKLKVEEIIEFSGIRNSIYEPVKNYSNGMYLRLALSIALFTNNEIFLIDEVISVGDVEFKEKGIRKIKEQCKEGKSCIIISHDLNNILEFCTSCILLENGQIKMKGSTKEVVKYYYSKYFDKLPSTIIKEVNQSKCRLLNSSLEKQNYEMHEEIKVKVNYEVKEIGDYIIFLTIRSYQSKVMTASTEFNKLHQLKNMAIGKYEVTCIFPPNIFNSGNFIIDVIVADENIAYFRQEQALQFTININEEERFKKWNQINEIIPFRPLCQWSTKILDS